MTRHPISRRTKELATINHDRSVGRFRKAVGLQALEDITSGIIPGGVEKHDHRVAVVREIRART